MWLPELYDHFAAPALSLLVFGLVWWIVGRGLWRGRRGAGLWGLVLAGVVVGVASNIEAWRARNAFQGALARVGKEAILPERLDLAPGALLFVENRNEAGVSSGTRSRAHFAQATAGGAPFTEIRHESTYRAFPAISRGEPLSGTADLWTLIEAPDRTRPFPYRYLWLATNTFLIYGYEGDGSFDRPDWPKSAKAVFLLIELPEDGFLDLSDLDGEAGDLRGKVLYRRLNIAEDVARDFGWGLVSDYTIRPGARAVLGDLMERLGAAPEPEE